MLTKADISRVGVLLAGLVVGLLFVRRSASRFEARRMRDGSWDADGPVKPTTGPIDHLGSTSGVSSRSYWNQTRAAWANSGGAQPAGGPVESGGVESGYSRASLYESMRHALGVATVTAICAAAVFLGLALFNAHRLTTGDRDAIPWRSFWIFAGVMTCIYYIGGVAGGLVGFAVRTIESERLRWAICAGVIATVAFVAFGAAELLFPYDIERFFAEGPSVVDPDDGWSTMRAAPVIGVFCAVLVATMHKQVKARAEAVASRVAGGGKSRGVE